ncbi:hypothetical protein EJ06DRAFT_30972 [Trichodelitschia bisporula]|uniref:Uncharacterized protein n=1 Tax=Trichodelitschia bisporula TaxID=703511 RepID=A0A6G1IBU5_9PEZI|nr:hypothetical protein EJ06DRAFT_30972 [Trichodelitschia bisporula]
MRDACFSDVVVHRDAGAASKLPAPPPRPILFRSPSTRPPDFQLASCFPRPSRHSSPDPGGGHVSRALAPLSPSDMIMRYLPARPRTVSLPGSELGCFPARSQPPTLPHSPSQFQFISDVAIGLISESDFNNKYYKSSPQHD